MGDRVLGRVGPSDDSPLWRDLLPVTEDDPLVRSTKVVIKDRQCLSFISVSQGIEDGLVRADQVVAEILVRHIATE